MDLHQEYWDRKKVKAPMIRFVDRGNLILKAKGKSEWAWLHINITSNQDVTHPMKYSFVVSANPQLYATSDMSHFAQQSKVVKEHVWEWEQYEIGLVEWAKEHAPNYKAITSQDAVFVAWEIFITNYDAWIANFLPYRIQDGIYRTVCENNSMTQRLEDIKLVEDHLREKYERVFLCWKNIKGAIEHKNYADWLAKIINEMPT